MADIVDTEGPLPRCAVIGCGGPSGADGSVAACAVVSPIPPYAEGAVEQDEVGYNVFWLCKRHVEELRGEEARHLERYAGEQEGYRPTSNDLAIRLYTLSFAHASHGTPQWLDARARPAKYWKGYGSYSLAKQFARMHVRRAAMMRAYGSNADDAAKESNEPARTTRRKGRQASLETNVEANA